MKGTMLIFRPEHRHPELVEFDCPVELDDLKTAIDGGHLEAVPGFRTIAFENIVMNCIAFCDEDGKRKRLELNELATCAWYTALHRHARVATSDYLVGPVAVVFGDREFMGVL